MATQITGYECKNRLTDCPELTIEAQADDDFGDVLMSIRINYPDGHSSIAAITVDRNKWYIASDLDRGM